MITGYDSFMPLDFCEEFLNFASASNWLPSKTGTQDGAFTYFIRDKDDGYFTKEISRRVAEVTGSTVKPIVSNFNGLSAGMKVGWHTDSEFGSTQTVVWYPNFGWDEGMGGELEILDGDKLLRVEPSFNRCLIYGADVIHRVNEHRNKQFMRLSVAIHFTN